MYKKDNQNYKVGKIIQMDNNLLYKFCSTHLQDSLNLLVTYIEMSNILNIMLLIILHINNMFNDIFYRFLCQYHRNNDFHIALCTFYSLLTYKYLINKVSINFLCKFNITNLHKEDNFNLLYKFQLGSLLDIYLKLVNIQISKRYI